MHASPEPSNHGLSAIAIAIVAALGAVGALSPRAEAVITTCTGVGTNFAGGAGTAASPYQVATAAQLAGITSGYRACAFVQTADIDISGQQWPRIGTTSGTAFTGTYDGQSHTVRGLTISQSTSDGNALFGVTDGATISNLTVADVAIDEYTNAAYRKDWNAALIGTAIATTVQNCHSSGSIEGLSNGGLIGYSIGSTITGSSSSAVITGHDWSSGGLVGSMVASTTITSSFATGNVTTTSIWAGGLLGSAANTATITRSYATGNVSYVGNRTGINGWGWAIGGLVGMMNTPTGVITQSYATGNVVGGSRGTGGLVGLLWDTGHLTVSDSYATGHVTGDRDTDGLFYVGGLLGGSTGVQAQAAIIVNSYATSAVTTVPSGGGGGLFGWVRLPPAGSTQPDITRSFWSTGTAGADVSSPYGTQATVAQMKSLALYADASWTIVGGWSASGTWGICDGAGYPFLLWQYRSSPCGGQGTPGSSSAPESVPGSGASSSSAGSAPARLRVNRPVQRHGRVITTGRVPAGATVVVQGATRRRAASARPSRSDAREQATTTCPITTNGRARARVFTCSLRLARGPWTLTTEARQGSTLTATATHAVTVRVPPGPPVTG